jgi:hypothetical protein
MKLDEAVQIISDFEGNNLRLRLGDIKNEIVGKSGNEILQRNEVFEAALIIKKLSSQIDEIVHASGIINCLPKILLENEYVESLSLASGAEGEGIDLVTNYRIAEFKFSQWQSDAANGMRKRQVFADCVNLYLHPTSKKKELYVIGAETIKKYFQSNRASWRKVLSKSGGLDKKLAEYLSEKRIYGEFLNDIYSISNVEIFEIKNFLNDKASK